MRFAQTALVRFVRRADAWFHDAGRFRAPGRGVYLCSRGCALRVVKNKRFVGLASVAQEAIGADALAGATGKAGSDAEV